jgi:Tfp pilus assembly protein PilO
VVALLLVVVGVFTFLAWRERGRLVDEDTQLERKIKEHERVISREENLKARMDGMKLRFANVRQYLPDEKEVDKLINAFSDKCIEAKLEVVKLSKTRAQSSRRRGRGRGGAGTQQVEKLQYQGKFTGTFHSMAKFVSMVEDWEHFKRFVSITDLKTKAAKDGMVFDSGAQQHDMTMTFELYMYKQPDRAAGAKSRTTASR